MFIAEYSALVTCAFLIVSCCSFVKLKLNNTSLVTGTVGATQDAGPKIKLYRWRRYPRVAYAAASKTIGSRYTTGVKQKQYRMFACVVGTEKEGRP